MGDLFMKKKNLKRSLAALLTAAAITASVSAPSGFAEDGIKAVSAGGWNEMLYVVFSGITDADVTGVSYSGAASGTLTGDDLTYLVRDTDAGLRVDIPGVPAGTYSVTLTTAKGTIVQSGLEVNAQDRSGYAHFQYTEGVGAYRDDGTLKPDAIVLYVTDENKDTVSFTSKDGTTVTGIGNILNSAGQDMGDGKTSGGSTVTNTNSDIIKKLAEDGTPLVVRIVGDVTAPYGVTAYNTTDFGGLKGDNGFMARMKSGKDITIEGVGTDATINGWGLHFICDSSAPELGKSFEVRNLSFRNVPEDAIGMEGVQDGDVVTASVERCWIHNNEFYVPSIENPAESDKKQGDGACDFKRGQYFTNSYNYYEGYHKTNLVGANDKNLQYNLSFHNNYWKDCAARGPLARQANIHLYNNIYEHQTDVGQDSRANSYFFSEYNLFENCDDCTVIKSGGAIKSFHDSFVNCEHETTGTPVESRDQAIPNNNKYPDFDTNPELSYIPTGDYILETDTTKLKDEFAIEGGTMDETDIVNGVTSIDGDAQPTEPTQPAETEETTGSTESTEATELTEPTDTTAPDETDETEESTEPTEVTESTEASTDPAEETTEDPTEATAEVTTEAPTTEPSEETTEETTAAPTTETDAETTAPAEETTETVQAETFLGDVNGDKTIDILDVIKLNRYLLGSSPLDAQSKRNADVDQNGEADSTDSLMILKYVIELITSFEA